MRNVTSQPTLTDRLCDRLVATWHGARSCSDTGASVSRVTDEPLRTSSCSTKPLASVVLVSVTGVEAEGSSLAVICDVDGTLCDVRGIRYLVERPPGADRFRADFAAFHRRSRECAPFPRVVNLVAGLAQAGYLIVVVTGREARWASLTQNWLAAYEVPCAELLTRADLDYRPDAVVKAEICADVRNRYSARLAIDDRRDILEVWGEACIPTIEVDPVGFLSEIRWPTGTYDAGLQEIAKASVRGVGP